MKKLLVVAFAALLPVAFADDVNTQILKQLDLLQKQVAQQQAEIQALKTQLNQAATPAAVSQMIDQAIEQKAVAEVKDTGLLTLGQDITNLKLTGDLLLRYQRSVLDVDNRFVNNADDDRFSTRFRLGLVWTNPSESWEVGAGLITGNNLNAAGVNPVDHNSTWNNTVPFETSDLRLDYAYAKHTWDCVSFTIGQQKNPFKDIGILWDTDIRLTGASLAYDGGPVFGTLGIYDVFYPGQAIVGGADSSLADHAMMYAGQFGVKAVQEDFDASLSAALYWFNDQATNLANSRGGLALDKDHAFQVGSLLGDINGVFGDVKAGLYGQVWKNFGATGNKGQSQARGTVDPEDNDLGFVIGAKAGIGPVGVSYDYVRFEADSAPSLFKDGDFGAGCYGFFRDIDVKGHRIMATYNLTKNCWLGGSLLLYDTIEKAQACDGTLYQLDLNYRF